MPQLTKNITRLYKADAKKKVLELYAYYNLSADAVDDILEFAEQDRYSATHDPLGDGWSGIATLAILDQDVNYRTRTRAWLLKMVEAYLRNGKLTPKQTQIIIENLR